MKNNSFMTNDQLLLIFLIKVNIFENVHRQYRVLEYSKNMKIAESLIYRSLDKSFLSILCICIANLSTQKKTCLHDIGAILHQIEIA